MQNCSGKNDEDAFGIQAIVNEAGEVEGFNDRLLIGASDISLNEAVELIHSLNGLAIASHIDRQAFGIIGQLGFVPPDVPFDALEVSANLGITRGTAAIPGAERISDHYLIRCPLRSGYRQGMHTHVSGKPNLTGNQTGDLKADGQICPGVDHA
ncbi:MAG: hypothetical protein MZW92_06045 [Comamonadaceae bacterium]|nr:hypothetical protein [Comamonadaceae bacterium]